jgi:hypothetical protein
MKLIAALVVAFTILAVTGTAVALHLKPLTGRTESGGQEIGPVQKWISGLLSGAIFGALTGILLSLLGSWIAPRYWGSLDLWGMAGCGAAGGMFAHCFERKSKNST